MGIQITPFGGLLVSNPYVRILNSESPEEARFTDSLAI